MEIFTIQEQTDFTYTTAAGTFSSFEECMNVKQPNNIFTTSNVKICGTIYSLKMYIDKDLIESDIEDSWDQTYDLEITRDNDNTICIHICNYRTHYTDIIYKVVGFPRLCYKRATELHRVYINMSHYKKLISELFANEPMTKLDLFFETKDDIEKESFNMPVSSNLVKIDTVYHACCIDGVEWFLYEHEKQVIVFQEVGGKHGSMEYIPDFMLDALAEPEGMFYGTITDNKIYR